MRKRFIIGFIIVISGIWTPLAMAHFGMIIPSDEMVMQQDNRTIQLTLSFSHPFELVGMEMAKPVIFNVVTKNSTTDLRDQLQKISVMDQTAWKVITKSPGPAAISFIWNRNLTGSRPKRVLLSTTPKPLWPLLATAKAGTGSWV